MSSAGPAEACQDESEHVCETRSALIKVVIACSEVHHITSVEQLLLMFAFGKLHGKLYKVVNSVN